MRGSSWAAAAFHTAAKLNARYHLLTEDAADAALCADTKADCLISNFGVHNSPVETVHQIDVEGVVLSMGVRHEQVLTVVTRRDGMWLTHIARQPRVGLLDGVESLLTSAARAEI